MGLSSSKAKINKNEEMKIINNINESKTNNYLVQTKNTVKNKLNESDEEINFKMEEIEEIVQIEKPEETKEIKDNINENENEKIINNEIKDNINENVNENEKIINNEIQTNINENENENQEIINYEIQGCSSSSDDEQPNDNNLKNNNLEYKPLKGTQYDLIMENADSFLEGKMRDKCELFKYVTDVDKYISSEIKYIKRNFNKYLIKPEKAIKNENYIIQFLGCVGFELLLYTPKIYVEILPSNEIIRDITFKMILSGFTFQRVYKLIIESSKQKIQFKKDINNWYKFNQKLKEKINNYKYLNLEVYFFNYDIINFEVSMIIYNQSFNDIEKILKNHFIKIVRYNLLNHIVLSPNMFATNFCKNINDWPNENYLYRGGERYTPPYGWKGFAIKLRNKFGENNDWLGKTGENENEWCIAYHGIGNGSEFYKVLNILNDNLKSGPNQHLKYDKNHGKYTTEEYRKCGEGVYLTPNIKYAENYTRIISLGKNNKNFFKFAIMARVNPKKIRTPGKLPLNWILNDNNDEIRPYRLLVKSYP